MVLKKEILYTQHFFFPHFMSHLLFFSFLTSLHLSPSSFLCILSSFVTHLLQPHHTSFPFHPLPPRPLSTFVKTHCHTIHFSLFFVVQVSLECKSLFLAFSFALIWFFFKGSWCFCANFCYFSVLVGKFLLFKFL